MALTPRQKDVLDFIASFQERNGYCPSYDEIARNLDLASLATVHKHIQALEAKKYLRRRFNHSRSIEIDARYFEERPRVPPQAEERSVPLLGRIAAGAPVEQFESPETIQFSDFAGRGDVYALQVRGDSMIDDHICDGDYVLIENTKDVRNGDIVAAMVRGSESTLKRIYREPDGTVRLQPANSAMEPILAPAAEVDIRGKLLAVLRKYR